MAQAGDERYLVCAAVAAGVVLTCDWLYTVGVAPRCSVRVCVCVCVCVRVYLIVFIRCFGILDCRSQWTGCVNVAMLCCHLPRELRVGNVRLQNAF